MLFNPVERHALSLSATLKYVHMAWLTPLPSSNVWIHGGMQKGTKRRKGERERGRGERHVGYDGREEYQAARKNENKRAERERERDDVREGGWCGVKAASSTCKVRV